MASFLEQFDVWYAGVAPVRRTFWNAVIALASISWLAIVGVGFWYDLTANRKPPIEVLGVVVGEKNFAQAGTMIMVRAKMKWDLSRSCSVQAIKFRIRGPYGIQYIGPPVLTYSKESVKKLISESPDKYITFIGLPHDAFNGVSSLSWEGEYLCDDNRSFTDRVLRISGEQLFTVYGGKAVPTKREINEF